MWDYNRDGVIDDRDDDEYWSDVYFHEQEEHREELEEAGIDTLLMDDDEILESWENLPGGSYHKPVDQTVRPAHNPKKPAEKVPVTTPKQSRPKISLGSALIGGFVFMVLFSALFRVDVSKLSSLAFGALFILFCVIWALIRMFVLK